LNWWGLAGNSARSFHCAKAVIRASYSILATARDRQFEVPRCHREARCEIAQLTPNAAGGNALNFLSVRAGNAFRERHC
jgi:hypothetical protein